MTTSSVSARQRVDRLDAGRPAHQGDGLRLGERVVALRARLEARIDARAAGQVREAVREARGHVRNWQPERAVSAGTAQRYARVTSRMRTAGQRPEDAKCKSSYEFRRAALVHETRASLKAALSDLDRAKRSGDIDRAAEAYGRVRGGIDILRRYPPSTGDRERDLERSSVFLGPSRADADRSNGKRESLSGLPEDWRDRVQREVRDGDKAAVAAMSLTGCRPIEVRGIKVRRDADSLTLEIRGAKVDADRGVKTRSISIDKSELEQSQAGRDLADWLGNCECRTVKHDGGVEAFCGRVSRAADRADLDQVSAYTYRHSEARELKKDGLDKAEIAQRLGHKSERSQSVYG